MVSSITSRIVVAVALLVATTSAPAVNEAFAALPPDAQRLAELRAIVASGEVHTRLSKDGTPIDRIEYVETDLYRVTAGDCAVLVRIVDDPRSMDADMPGPRRFRLVVEDPVCDREQ